MTFGSPALYPSFWDRVVPEPNTGCWIWTGGGKGNGYGVARSPATGKARSAHRVAYEALVGEVPEGKEIDHLCRVKCCVNPAHLEAVTRSVNLRRRFLKTHCPKGHEYTEGNIYIRPPGSTRAGHRTCRACLWKTGRRRA